MSRKYTKAGHLAREVQRPHEEGKTYKKTGERHGLTRMRVKELMSRQRRKQRLIEHGYTPRSKGRPRKDSENESIRTQNELARLRMQVELLQNFLCEVGGGEVEIPCHRALPGQIQR